MGRDSIMLISNAGVVFIALPVFPHYKYTKKTFFSLSDCTEIKIPLKESALEPSTM